ncbi:MAG: hypothetical protein A4S14_10580 [Proteobacteria bacterium SG_bin9]|nr:MAG: hypothetical protein A4S14_10580 [Proteobacteria bacterium SG_bin9]
MSWAAIDVLNLICWAFVFGCSTISATRHGYRLTSTAFRTGRLLVHKSLEPIQQLSFVKKFWYWDYESHRAAFFIAPLTWLTIVAFLVLLFAVSLIASLVAIRIYHESTLSDQPIRSVQGIVVAALFTLVWSVYRFRLWAHRIPPRDPSQISTLHKIGRLSVGLCIAAPILYGIGWFIWGR